MDLNHAVSLYLLPCFPFNAPLCPQLRSCTRLIRSTAYQGCAVTFYPQLALHLGSFELLKPVNNLDGLIACCYVLRDGMSFSLFISLT